jgi:hypothetical protein
MTLALAAYYGFALMSMGYGWSEMDWDQDGTTSLNELLYSTEVGKREIVLDGEECTEYFRLKDAMPFRVDCGDESHR